MMKSLSLIKSKERHEILDSLSMDIYLHFLDRELLTSLGAYDYLSVLTVIQDVRLILFSSYEPCYLSASLIFENKFAKSLFKEFPFLFQTGHIELALKENSLHDFILTKRDQYTHAKDDYNFYYDDKWKDILENAPVFRKKSMDTSKYLEDDIVNDIQEEGILKSANRMDVSVNT